MQYHSIIRLSKIIGTIDQQFTPNLESCLTTMVENVHALSHLKHALPTKLQYCRDFGTIFRESVKRIVHWSTYYFTSDSSYYPVSTYNLPLDLVPIFPKPKTVSMQKEWTNTHSKCVRQRTVRHETTSYKCGTLPLNMYVSTSIEGTEVTFNHIDEYDNSESENETEETWSSQLSRVLVGNDDHESPAELSFSTTRNSSRSGRTLRVSSRLLDYIWPQSFCHLTSIVVSSVIMDFVFPFCLLRPQCIIQEALNLYSNTIISSFYYKLFFSFSIITDNSDTLTKHCHWPENRKYCHCKGNKSPETMTRPR